MDFFTPKYARDNGQWRFLGNNFTAESLKRKEIRTTVVTEHLLEMFPGVFLLRNFPPAPTILNCQTPPVFTCSKMGGL